MEDFNTIRTKTIEYDYQELEYCLLMIDSAIAMKCDKETYKFYRKDFMRLIKYLKKIGLIGGEE